MQYPEPIAKLIDSYTKLPGIGIKTATRLAFHTIDMQEEDVTGFAQSLISAKRDLRFCSIENTGEYRGLYHVLHGVLSPLSGKGPDDINIESLATRLQKDDAIQEVIVATNANAEGEATAMYLSRLLKPAGLTVSRLATGLSVGSDIDYADEITLIKAVEGRTKL